MSIFLGLVDNIHIIFRIYNKTRLCTRKIVTITFYRYVDSGRCVSTELGGTNQDLKDKMASSGIRGISEFDRTRSGCTNEMMYLRQVMGLSKLSKL